MVSPKNCTSKQALVRLWVHESMRVFHDRLIDEQDKTHFKGILTELVNKNLSSAVGPASELLPQEGSILFGDFLQPDLEPEDRAYQEVRLHTHMSTLWPGSEQGKLTNFTDMFLGVIHGIAAMIEP